MSTDATADSLCDTYLGACLDVMRRIRTEETAAIEAAAALMADACQDDRLIYIYGPGGHSNLAAQEIFYRAGGLMNICPLLDEGTLLSNGAMRSTAMERLPGYGRVVIEASPIARGDLLILVNTFGVNAATIDAAQAANDRGAIVIGINSRAASLAIPADHPARHPSAANLQDLVRIAIDNKVPNGDAVVVAHEGEPPLGPVSTQANSFVLQSLIIHTVCCLKAQGVAPVVWRSRNASGGEHNNFDVIAAMRRRVPVL